MKIGEGKKGRGGGGCVSEENVGWKQMVQVCPAGLVGASLLNERGG